MNTKPYFSFREMLLMLGLALAGAVTFYYFPIPDIEWPGPFMQPGSAYALFGGILFVFWLCLSRVFINKRWAVPVTAVFLASIEGIISPGHLVSLHGLASPAVFFIFRYAGILAASVIIELAFRQTFWRQVLYGGAANLLGTGVVWAAFAFEFISPWRWLRLLSPVNWIAYACAAIISGAAGALLAQLVCGLIKKAIPRKLGA
jgi:hypothetical protein